MEQNNSPRISARTLTWFSILTALVIVLQSLSGYMKILSVEINLTLVPVVLGALVMGPLCGGLLGLISGVITLLFGVFGWAPLTYAMFSFSPLLTSAICLVKCTAAGVACGWVYRLARSINKYVATFIASGVAPIVNTGLFVLGASFFKEVFVGLGLLKASDQIVLGIILLILVNFIVELILNMVLSPAIYRVCEIIEKKKY